MCSPFLPRGGVGLRTLFLERGNSFLQRNLFCLIFPAVNRYSLVIVAHAAECRVYSWRVRVFAPNSKNSVKNGMMCAEPRQYGRQRLDAGLPPCILAETALSPSWKQNSAASSL